MQRSARIGLMLWLLTGSPAASQAPDSSVKLKVVKYAGLTEAVSQLKGKVVVVDFWADF